MTDHTTEPDVSAVRGVPKPAVADRAAFQAELDQLRVREKAHTRAGDAIAAARRRLPMVEVDSKTPLIGADGAVPLIDVFEGRSQLIAYFHMWHHGRPAAEQCEGCTFSTSQVTELGYLHSRDVSYAVLSEGAYEETSRYREFMGYPVPWYSVPPDSVDRLIAGRHFGILACYLRDGDQVFETYWNTSRGNEIMAPSYGLLDQTVYGRQELWEDSPEGWPQRWGSRGGQFRWNGRPAAQWSRVHAGRDDDLGPTPD
ncbi:thioredoxin domain-containing protein [Flindersiella endophytica]